MPHDDPPRRHLHPVEPPYDPDHDTSRPVHQNHPAEQAVLGALLLAPELAEELQPHLEPDDFYRPAHEMVWNAIHHVAQHEAVLPDPITVAAHLTKTGELTKIGGAPYLHDLMAACPLPRQAETYAAKVRDAARLRRLQDTTTRLQAIVNTGHVDELEQTFTRFYEELDTAAARTGPNTLTRRHIDTIDDLLAGEDDDTYDWVIPGLLEHQERVILTAEEGAGKSTLLRQIAIQAAAGLHPFTGELIDPLTVLHIDVENTRRQSRRRYRPMRIRAGSMLHPDRLRIELRTAGIDLTTTEDRDWLLSTCAQIQPDLLLIGPIYKLANGDPTEEKSAKPVAMAIDAVRDQTDCAVILEAHAAKAPSGQKKRPHEPYGWSGWLRWPEVGLWLDTDGTLTPWRGAREERSWPERLERGGDWPWSPAITETAQLWNQVRIARQAHGEPMSMRQVSTSTGLSLGTVQRLIGKNARYHYAWNGLNGTKNTES